MANAVLPVVDAAGVGLVINDFPEVAAKLGAAWCHLGQEDFSGYSNVDQIFSRFPSPISRSAPFQIGLSTHNPAQAERAIAAKAGYIGVGPVFPTATKPLVKPVTLEYVRWAAQHVSIAWFAIGGITLENVEEVIEAGARRVCVVSAILEAPDLVEACQKFKDRLTSARGND